MPIIDANVILRYLLNDHPAMSVDCLLAGYHHMNGEEIVTFDEKLHKAIIKDQIQE